MLDPFAVRVNELNADQSISERDSFAGRRNRAKDSDLVLAS